MTSSNLSRIIDSTPFDVLFKRRKVDVAARYLARTSPSTNVTSVVGNVTYTTDAERILEADYIFLATDTAFARFAFNAICHQYLIPGCQIGAKVTTKPDGAIDLIYTAVRHLHFQDGCLLCANLIPLDKLHDEQLSDDQRRDQRYADAPDGLEIEDPSVITLNTISAGHAVNTMLMSFTCLVNDDVVLAQELHYPMENTTRSRDMIAKPGCAICDRMAATSGFARGDLWPLPLRVGASPQLEVRRGARARLLARLKRLVERGSVRPQRQG